MNRFSSHVNKFRPTKIKKILFTLVLYTLRRFYSTLYSRKRHNLGNLYGIMPKLCRLYIYFILYRRYGHQHRLNQAKCNHDH